MQKTILILLLIIRGCSYAFAQDGIDIRGTVKDSISSVLPKATIYLFTPTDTVSTLSRENGSFHFRIPATRSFEISVTMEGYAPFRKIYQIDPFTRSLTLLPILLQTTYGDLAPVYVQQVKSIRIREDTIDYHASAFYIRPGSELEELLKKLPGLEVDMDGTVRVMGKKISRVMVDGKDFPGDILTAIHNLPVDIIDIVQVIDDYGDKARLTGVKNGESLKILNVILKRDKKNGAFGQLQLDAGNKNKYNSTLFTDAIKNGRQMTLNARLRNQSPAGNIYEKGIYFGYNNNWGSKWAGSGSLATWGDHHSSQTGQIQDNFILGSHTHQEQSNLIAGNNNNIGISFTSIYTPDANTILRLTPSINIGRILTTTTNQFSSLVQDSGFSKTLIGNSHNSNNSHNLTTGADIYFQKILPRSQNRFSLQASYHYSNRPQNADNLTISNTQMNNQIQGILSIQHYLFRTINITHDLSTALNYYVSLGKTTFLELGYNCLIVAAENTLLTRTPDSAGSAPLPVDSLSNAYRFTTTTQRFHTGYTAHLAKINLSLSMDAQPLIQNGQTVGKGLQQNYYYFNLFPQAQLSYSFTSERKLNIEYNSKSLPPEFRQLQPVTDISNPQYPVTGNPNLKPSFDQDIKVNYTQFVAHPSWIQGFTVELSYSSSRNMIIPVVFQPRDTSTVIQQTSYMNANGFSSFAANYYLNFPAFLHRYLRISLTGNFTKRLIPTMAGNISYTSTSMNWDQGLTIKLDIPNVIQSELAGSYTNTISQYSPVVSSISTPNASWALTNRHYLLKQWILAYAISQVFTSGINQRLITNPAIVNASLSREFFSNNKAKLSFSVNDLLNNATGISQLVTSTGTVQNRTALLGRYFIVSFQVKLQKFR